MDRSTGISIMTKIPLPYLPSDCVAISTTVATSATLGHEHKRVLATHRLGWFVCVCVQWAFCTFLPLESSHTSSGFELTRKRNCIATRVMY